MRTATLVLLFFLISSSSAKGIDLFRLSDTKQKPLAPVELRRQLAHDLLKNLEECLSDPKWELKAGEDFFGAISIPLSTSSDATWLAYPTQYCPGGISGGNETSYWIVQRKHDGSYKLLYSGTGQSIEVLGETNNGLHDFNEMHGTMELVPITYQFDGKEYVIKRRHPKRPKLGQSQ